MSPDLRRDKVAILKQYYVDIIAGTKASLRRTTFLED